MNKSDKNTTYNTNARKLDDVSILRAFAIVLVVISHSFDLNTFSLENNHRLLYHYMYYVIMGGKIPLFVFLSGYLFSYLLNKKAHYQSFYRFVTQKFKRLIIPYTIFYTLYAVAFDGFNFSILTSGSYYHLW
jgi:fucose 4-O-acetylase-like acetyltransferase